MTNYETYPSYKDSGVEWLGEIPESWETSRLGTRFEERRQKVSDTEFAPLSVTKNGILPQLDTAAKTNDGDNRKLVRAGDFVINSRSDRKGSSGVSDRDGSVSLINIVMEPQNVEPRFCNYLLKGYSFTEEFYRNGHGIVADLWTTRYDEMKNIKTAFPSVPEQTAIANFLDDKTAKIDKAIAQKEQLIALLGERKQIIIQNAVTKGLDPTVKMKPSGIEWIGEIPEHWEVSKLGHFSTISNGATPNREISRYWSNGTIPWMASGKVNDFHITTPSELVTESALRDCSIRIYPTGTVLIGIVGQGKTRGTSALLKIPAAINQNVAGIIPNRKLSSEFLHLYLTQAYEQIRNYGKGSNQEALNCQLVAAIKITVPPVSEQKRINDYIAAQSERFGSAICRAEDSIQALREYRATLIDSAVTGKIDVRDVSFMSQP